MKTFKVLLYKLKLNEKYKNLLAKVSERRSDDYYQRKPLEYCQQVQYHWIDAIR